MTLLAADTWPGQANGKGLILDYSTYADALDEGKGEVDIGIYQTGADNAPDRIEGMFVLFLRDFDTRWLRRFWDLYQQDPSFRQNADNFYRFGAYRNPASRHDMELPGGAGIISVDADLADAIWTLHAQGFETLEACAGGANRKAYVVARHLPPELEEVADRAGFLVGTGHITVDIPFTQPMAAEVACKAFVRMLNDWARGELGRATDYQNYLQHMRPCSLVSFPPGAVPTRQRPPHIVALIQKNLRGEAGVNDYARLRSGRDEFSTMDLPHLLEATGHQELPKTLSSWEPALAKRVVRWMARGLPEGMALQKVAVEETMTERAREKSKRDKEPTGSKS